MIEIQSDICALERFAPDLAFKAAAVQEGIIRGYASTFGGEADSYGDVIAAGAFSKTLSEHAGKKTTPAMLWAHDPANPIGKWTRLVEDSMGLAVEGKLTLAVPRAQEA